MVAFGTFGLEDIEVVLPLACGRSSCSSSRSGLRPGASNRPLLPVKRRCEKKLGDCHEKSWYATRMPGPSPPSTVEHGGNLLPFHARQAERYNTLMYITETL